MMTLYNLGCGIPTSLFQKVKAVSPKIVSLGSDGLIEITDPLTNAEIKAIKAVIARHDILSQIYENTIKWSDLTLTELDNYIDNNVTDLASARIYLKKLSRAVLFLLQREIAP